MMPSDNEMLIEYDKEIQSYYVAWRPVTAVGLGKTEKGALEELRKTAHYGIDTMVDLKLKEIVRKEGNGHGKQG